LQKAAQRLQGQKLKREGIIFICGGRIGLGYFK